MTKENLFENNKSLCIILDPAHGSDVKGKCSPDGTHKEYKWSREICKKVSDILESKGYQVEFTNKTEKEIGLTKRKTVANEIKVREPGMVKLLISLHNNAAGMGDNWTRATGVEIWTSRGKTQSDIFSTMMYNRFRKDFTDLNFRVGGDIYDQDKDENFTVLMGNYYAMLIEWLFQDSSIDIDDLKDPLINDSFCNSLVKGIDDINDYIISNLKNKLK